MLLSQNAFQAKRTNGIRLPGGGLSAGDGLHLCVRPEMMKKPVDKIRRMLLV